MAKGKKSGGGSRKGVPNKATANAREAVAAFVDQNTQRLNDLLTQIEQEDGPLAAFKCITDLIEYHVPKLARTEMVGDGGKPIEVQVVRYSDTPAK